MPQKVTKKNKPKPNHPVKSDNVPVTLRHLELVKQELKSDITSVGLRVDSLQLKMDAGFSRLESAMAEIKSTVFRMDARQEEQNSRNLYVLDGYASLHDKQNSTDVRVGKLEKKVFGTEQK